MTGVSGYVSSTRLLPLALFMGNWGLDVKVHILLPLGQPKMSGRGDA